MLRNLKPQLKFLQVIKPAAAVTADTDSSAIETSDLLSLGFLVNVGTMAFDGSNKIALKFLESSDNVTFAAAAAEAYEGGAPFELDSGAKDDSAHFVEYKGHAKYVKLQLDVTGTVSVFIDAAAIGKSEIQPPL